MSEERLKAFEIELAALRPRSDTLDRDRLMFEAGRASVTGAAICRGSWGPIVRQAASMAAVALVAAGLALWFGRPEPGVVERIVEKQGRGERGEGRGGQARDEAPWLVTITAPSGSIPGNNRTATALGDLAGRNTPYQRELDQVLALAQQRDAPRPHRGTGGQKPQETDREESAVPALSRQSLRSLLDELTRTESDLSCSTPAI